MWKPNLSGILKTFIPDKNVKVTPIIISANVLVYLIMVLTGVDFLMPETDDLLAWGSSNAGDVTSGEYWRLFTSNYLHFGIIHLAVNMLSLNNVGRMLEQFIGPWRFALIYTFAGIAGSAASIWWNPYANGVGASGAVIGIVGILLALLTTNLIERKARFSMLRSMAISAGLMILISFQANVDNAAHLGGLAAGMIGGYFIYPELRAWYYQKKKQYLGLAAALLVIAGATIWFATHTKAFNVRTIQQMIDDFSQRELTAQQNFSNGLYTTAEAVDKNVVEVYRFGLKQMDTIGQMEINEEFAAYLVKVEDYLNARKKYYEYVAKDMQSPERKFRDSATVWRKQSDSLLNVVNSR